MSKRIIGVTVGTPISPKAIERKLKPVKTVNGVEPDENGNVEVEGGSGTRIYIGPEQPTDGSLYWLDTSEGETPDAPTGVTLTGISATYSGGDVAVGTDVSSLSGVVVIATYSDGSSKAVTGYILSGTIAEGSNTITVAYEGKTTTFTVTGVAELVTYTIANQLTYVTSSNSSTSVQENASYSATLTAAEGYELDSVTVTMGGVDVTTDVYADGVITISSVTGNVVITAIAVTEDAGVDLSEENTFRSIDGPLFTFTGDEWTAFMELDVEKLYFYVPQSDKYGRNYNIAAKYTPSWGYHSFASMTAADAAKKENHYMTNGWNKWATDGYDVVEIDVKAVQDTVRQMYNSGELDENKEKIINIDAQKILAGGTAYLLYNYGG